jgi:protein SDA1
VELLAADDERIARGERSAVDSASDDDEAAGSSESDGSLDSDIDDDEIDNALNIEGDGDDDDGEGEGEGEDESDDGEEGDDDDDDDDDEADADADGEAADGAPSPRAPASAAQRIDVSRLLTDEDFARLRKLKEAHLKAQLAVGNKRARAGEEEELHRDALRSNLLREEAIDPTDLEGVAARKRKSREDKLAAVMEGRTDRSQFGHKRKKSETGTLTNREKSHTKNFMMHRHKRAISGKMMRSQNDKQNAKTNASKGKYKKNKKCGRR